MNFPKSSSPTVPIRAVGSPRRLIVTRAVAAGPPPWMLRPGQLALGIRGRVFRDDAQIVDGCLAQRDDRSHVSRPAGGTSGLCPGIFRSWRFQHFQKCFQADLDLFEIEARPGRSPEANEVYLPFSGLRPVPGNRKSAVRSISGSERPPPWARLDFTPVMRRSTGPWPVNLHGQSGRVMKDRARAAMGSVSWGTSKSKTLRPVHRSSSTTHSPGPDRSG